MTTDMIDEDPTDSAYDNESEPAPLPDGVESIKALPLRWSKRRDKLAAAMAKAQGEMGLAEKDRTNTHLSSSYASLGSIREVGRIPLSRHGIAVFQGPLVDDKRVTVLTQLVHSSGQWVECEITFIAEYMKGLNWMQVFGNVLSYARRYTLLAITSTAVREDDDDDDGQALSEPDGRRSGGPREPAPKIPMPQSYEELLAAIDGLKSDAEAGELWRMGRFLPFETTKEQSNEAAKRHRAKWDALKKAAAVGHGADAPKTTQVADAIKESKKGNAEAKADAAMKDGNPPTFDCAFCNSEIRVGGLYIDKGHTVAKNGAHRCSACTAKGVEQ